MESKFTELSMLFEDVDLAINNLHDWVKERPVSKPNLLLWGLDKMMLRPEPYGVTLIISPWNYPIQLSLVTLVGAIAAGNCTLLKVTIKFISNHPLYHIQQFIYEFFQKKLEIST